MCLRFIKNARLNISRSETGKMTDLYGCFWSILTSGKIK